MRWIKQVISVALVLFPALTFADDLGLVRLSLIDGDKFSVKRIFL